MQQQKLDFELDIIASSRLGEGVFNCPDLRAFVKEILENGTYLSQRPCNETKHGQTRRKQRNIDMSDIIHGLEMQDWTYHHTPEYNRRFQEWKYTIKTSDVDGCELHIVIAVSRRRYTLKVVTSW